MTRYRRRKPKWKIELLDEYRDALMKDMSEIQAKRGIQFRSWGDFLVQCTNLMWGNVTGNFGVLIRYSTYIYVAVCPKCSGRTTIKLMKRQLVAIVECECGRTFVVAKKFIMLGLP